MLSAAKDAAQTQSPLIVPTNAHHQALAAFFERQSREIDFSAKIYAPEQVQNILDLAHSNQWLRIACNESGDVVAFAHARLQQHEGQAALHLITMAVDPSARAMGFGRKILLALQSYAREQSCKHITLEVSESNRKAVGVFEANGYRTYKRAMALTLHD